jgi:starvation-inducible DNA-binding protein
MYDTRNDLPVNVRTKAVEILNARLADSIDLLLQIKHAHWNVKGPHFISLHELFDKVAENVEEHVDTIAERVTALGGTAYGTLATVVRGTSLPPYPAETTDGLAHVAALADALSEYGKKVRKAIGATDDLGDADTADLFTQVSRDVDKYLWFLEAHLHANRR